MTAWELQLAANAHGKATATLAWLTAGYQRSKKLKPLKDITSSYDLKVSKGKKAETRNTNLYQAMMAMVRKQESSPEAE